MGESHVNPTDMRRKTNDLKLWPNQSKLYCAHPGAKSVAVSHKEPRTSFLSLFNRAKPQGERFYRQVWLQKQDQVVKEIFLKHLLQTVLCSQGWVTAQYQETET